MKFLSKLQLLVLAGFATTAFLPASKAVAQVYLYNRASIPTGKGPAGMAVADFNGDGILDVAVANARDNTVSIMLGKPGGDFAPQVTYATAPLPVVVQAADFNGDGKPDLAVLCLAVESTQNGSISILIGNGDGTFQNHADYNVGSNAYPAGMVAADLNGNGRVDLAAINVYDNTGSILFGNGDGTFQQQTVLPVGPLPTSIGSGDFNHDGRIDLITTNTGSGMVTVLLSKGDNGFKRLDWPFTFGYVGDSKVVVGDFNGDGNLDAVASSEASQQLFVLLGKGDGTLQAPLTTSNVLIGSPSTMLAGDFNRDGKLGIALTSAYVLLGNGDGTFQMPLESDAGPEADSLLAADFNRDGQLDLAVSDGYFNSVDILLGRGDGTFGGMTNVALSSDLYGPVAAVAADFNGDGRLDLAVEETGYPKGQLSVKLGNGDGTFHETVSSPLGTEAVNTGLMFAGDFNGDGKQDLILLTAYRLGIEVLLGNGDGTFQPPVDTPRPPGTQLGSLR